MMTRIITLAAIILIIGISTASIVNADEDVSEWFKQLRIFEIRLDLLTFIKLNS